MVYKPIYIYISLQQRKKARRQSPGELQYTFLWNESEISKP